MSASQNLFSLPAEETVIGAMLLDPCAVDAVLPLLTASDFFIGYLGRAYSCLQRLADGRQPTDVFTVANALGNQPLPDGEIDWLSLLARIARDTPSAGTAAAYAEIVRGFARRRALLDASTRIAQAARIEPDVGKALAESAAMLERIAEGKADAATVTLTDSLRETVDDIDRRFNAGDSIIGLPCGLVDIDTALSGFWPSNLYIIAARPAMGKSAFALQCALHCALRLDRPALVFSLEMAHVQLSRRALSSRSGVHLARLYNGQLQDSDWPQVNSTLAELMNAPLTYYDRAGLHVRELKAQARAHHRKQPLGMIVVDYIQLMRGDGENRNLEVGNISTELKNLARELEIPVIALSQLSRKVEERGNKRPQMADLRDSGSLEQDADVVAFLYRDEVYNAESEWRGVAEFIIAKFRDGETQNIKLAFQGECVRFADLSRSWADDYKRAESKQQERGFA